MRSIPFSLVRGWRAAVLLAVAACATPDRAAASCGDYLTLHNGSGHAAEYPTLPNTNSSNPPPPCHGPNCSGAPVHQPVPLAPASISGPQAKEVVQALDPLDADQSPRLAFDRDTNCVLPIDRTSSIFHPPRLG